MSSFSGSVRRPLSPAIFRCSLAASASRPKPSVTPGFRLRTISTGFHGGDLVIILAYGRVYLELEALLIRIGDVRAKTILLTDTLAAALRHRIDLILPVERGRVDAFSMHTATLAIIEALLVGIAAARPRDVLTSLRRLNRLRAMVAGKDTELGNDLKRKALGTKRRRKSADRVADPVAGDDNAQS